MSNFENDVECKSQFNLANFYIKIFYLIKVLK